VTSVIVPLCQRCARRTATGCEAFPDGIPRPILGEADGEMYDHRFPYPATAA
jgi:hypothetical protein